MSLGKNILKRCNELGINEKELSNLSNVKYETLRDLIRGKTNPSVDKVKKIAIALHTSTDQLIFDDDEWSDEDELKRLFLEVSKMKKENIKTAKQMLRALIIQNKSQEMINH